MPAPARRIHDRRRRELVVLHRVAVALSRSLSFSEVLAALSRELMFAVDRASECAISLWDEPGDQLVDIAAHTESGPPVWPRGEVYAPLDLYPATRRMLRAGRGCIEYRMTDPLIRPAVPLDGGSYLLGRAGEPAAERVDDAHGVSPPTARSRSERACCSSATSWPKTFVYSSGASTGFIRCSLPLSAVTRRTVAISCKRASTALT